MIFCILYRPATIRLAIFFQEFEKLLYYLNSRRQEILILGEFNIDILKDEKFQRDNKNLLSAYNLEKRHLYPTRVTPMSKTCVNQFITTNEIETEAMKMTISGHFTISAQLSHKLANEQHDPPCARIQN